MTDPESAGTEAPDADEQVIEPGLIARGLDALGMNSERNPAEGNNEIPPVTEGIVTEEAVAETAAETEEGRKKKIRKGMAGNAGAKHDRVSKVRADRRNPRKQPDFEDHGEESEAETAE